MKRMNVHFTTSLEIFQSGRVLVKENPVLFLIILHKYGAVKLWTCWSDLIFKKRRDYENGSTLVVKLGTTYSNGQPTCSKSEEIEYKSQCFSAFEAEEAINGLQALKNHSSLLGNG